MSALMRSEDYAAKHQMPHSRVKKLVRQSKTQYICTGNGGYLFKETELETKMWENVADTYSFESREAARARKEREAKAKEERKKASKSETKLGKGK